MRIGLLLLSFSLTLAADDSQRLLRVDHYVRVQSIAPSMSGQTAQVYVREVARAGLALRRADPGRVILFIHGAGTPAEVAFDVPYRDYSWMAYLAQAGFDVFSMDMTGYGRSTRPTLMNDPCALPAEQTLAILGAPCASVPAGPATTIDSDWHDIGAVVDYLRKLRGVDKVGLIGWSLGGPRAGGYASQHPEKVSRLALLSPAYARTARVETTAAAFNLQTRADLDANWDRQLGCPDQVDPAARESVWAEMLASDPAGATWGPGGRRAPNVGMHDWNPEVVAKMRIPALFVAPVHDKQALPERVRELHGDYGASDKVLIDLACTSHNALWEKNHLLLFQASLEWFTAGTVSGAKTGTVRLGY